MDGVGRVKLVKNGSSGVAISRIVATSRMLDDGFGVLASVSAIRLRLRLRRDVAFERDEWFWRDL